MWIETWNGLLDLLAPPVCAGCDLETPREALRTGFCDACFPLLDPVDAGARPPAPAAGVYVHGGPLADAIRRMKYGDRSEIGRALGPLLAGASRGYLGEIDVVVPVPSHPRRLAERGYEPSALLAAHVARALGVPRRFLLSRTRATPPQAGLPRNDRLLNVKRAFAAHARTRGARVLVIDDVRTTGATLAECAAVLRDAGAREVRTLALAVAEGDL